MAPSDVCISANVLTRKDTTMQKTLDELALAAAETPAAPQLGEILDTVRQTTEFSENAKSALDMMFEAWGERIAHDVVLANFVVSFGSLVNYTTSPVRRALSDAVKALLPPYLAKQGLLRALGLRERTILPPQVVIRFRNLLALQPGMFCFQPEGRLFSRVDGVDDLGGTVVLSSVPPATSYRVPLEQALTDFIFVQGNINGRKLVQPGRKTAFSSSQWRTEMEKQLIRKASASELQEMARAVYVPALMTAEEFGAWWKSEEAAVAPVSNERTPGAARSLFELDVLLTERMDASDSYLLEEDDIVKLQTFFDGRRAPVQPKDIKLAAEVICKLASVTDEASLQRMLGQYRKRLPFWPDIEAVPLKDVQLIELDLWGSLSAKQFPAFIRATRILFSSDYLASISPLLPLKAMNAVLPELELVQIAEAAANAPVYSADMLVWIWKNRKGTSAKMLDRLYMENVINAIVAMDLPKAWGAAQRELKKLLINDLELIKTVIDNAGDDVRTIIYAVQRAKGFNQGEQQSLLVKLSRHSTALKEILEGGEGRKMMTSAASKEDTSKNVDPIITSVKSLHAKHKELENLLNVLVPENRRAIEEARAHGDFRENAEYDAAKERRRFLTAQRTQLERDILHSQGVDFRTVNVEGIVIVGSAAELKSDAGEKIVYYVVGAFDSSPDHGCVAYRTPIGEALMGHKAGDKVTLPGGINATLEKVTALPESVLRLLQE